MGRLPEGVILLEKKIERAELVGIDDTITDEVDAILMYRKENPKVIEVYLKATCEKVLELPLEKLLEQVPREKLRKLLEKMKD